MTTNTGWQNQGNRFLNRRFGTRQVMWPLVVLAALVVGLLFALTYVFDRLDRVGAATPENSLPVSLVIGVVALLLSVAVIVVIFARLNLDTWKQPLGLPEGSVRAIIALLIIVLFFIVATYLYGDLASQGETRSLIGINAERLATIPTDDIVSLSPHEADAATIAVEVDASAEEVDGAAEGDATGDAAAGETPEPLFDVVLRTETTAAAEDLAKQIVTTVSTLVVAIAAFYFGSKASFRARPDPDQTRPGSGGDGNVDGDPAGGAPTTVAAPTITGLSPPSVKAGAASSGLTVVGTGFTEKSTVRIGDRPPLDAMLAEANMLSVEVMVELEQATEVRVINPDGQVSEPVTLEIEPVESPTPTPAATPAPTE